MFLHTFIHTHERIYTHYNHIIYIIDTNIDLLLFKFKLTISFLK